jgi:hypothetical protein
MLTLTMRTSEFGRLEVCFRRGRRVSVKTNGLMWLADRVHKLANNRIFIADVLDNHDILYTWTKYQSRSVLIERGKALYAPSTDLLNSENRSLGFGLQVSEETSS